MKRIQTGAGLGGLLALMLAIPAQAQTVDLEYELRAGGAYSDNVERTASNEIDSFAAVLGARVRGGKDTGRLQFALSSDVAYYEYLDSAVDGELVGSAFAESSYEFVPDTFSWELDGSFAQIRESLLRPAGPGNRDDVLTFSTGPTVSGRFGDAFEAQLEGRYTTSTYSNRDFDNDTLGARLVVGRRLSARSLVGVGVAFDDVTYDSQLGLGSFDFERREAFVRFQAEAARTSLSIDAGYAQVEGANVDDSGPMVRLEATRQLSPFISGFLAYTQQYPTSDAPALVPADALDREVLGDGSILTAAPRVAKSGEIGLRLNRPRTFAELAYAQTRETGLIVASGDRSLDSFRASVGRNFSPRSNGQIFALLTTEDLPVLTADADELSVGAELSLTFGRNLGLDFRVEYRDREGATALDTYTEIGAGVFLRYGRIARASASSAALR